MLCKSLQQYSQYSFFDGILKTSRVPHLFAIWESCLNLLQYSESHKSTIIADKLIKFAGHLVMVIVIKGCGKNLISKEKFFSKYILKTKQKNQQHHLGSVLYSSTITKWVD